MCLESSAIPKISMEKDTPIKTKENKKIEDHSRNPWLILGVLACGNFCNGFCYSLQAPFFPKEAESKGATSTQYGFVFSVYELALFIFANIVGKLIFYVHPKMLTISGQIIASLAIIGFGFLDLVNDTSTFVALAIFIRIVEGIAMATAKISIQAIGVTLFPNNVSTTFSILQSFVALGIIIGPIVGGVIYDNFGYGPPFFVVGGLLLLSAGISFLVVPCPKRAEQINNETPKQEGDRKRFFTNPEVLLYAGGIFTAAIMLSFNGATMEPHLRPKGYSVSNVGILYSVLGITFILVAPLSGWLCDRNIDTKLMCIVASSSKLICLILIGPMPFLELSSGWEVSVPAMALMGFNYAFQMGPSFRGITHIAESKGFATGVATYGLVTSVTTSSHALGAVIGPTLGGYILDVLNYDAGIYILFSFEMLMMTVLISYTTWTKCKEGKTMDENVEPIGIKIIACE